LSIITVRVNRALKKSLEKHRVKISETVRRLLEGHVVELELRDLGERLEALKGRLAGRIDAKLVARLVREDREVR